ncbi:MAG: hypothetical protein AAGK03_03595 [Pseudomonadota bacterium]
MKGFEPVTLTWGEDRYTVPPERQLALIAEIEDALADNSGTPAVIALTARRSPSYARIAAAYGAALRYAGAGVSNDEVYLLITQKMAEGDPSVSLVVQNAILGLLAIIAPPVHRRITMGAPGKETEEAEPKAE